MVHGGEIACKYDFSVNLNPVPTPEPVLHAIKQAAEQADRYPDRLQSAFRAHVCAAENVLAAGAYRLNEEMIVGGNGASELLFAIVNMLHPKKVLLPVPSFYGYRHALLAASGAEPKCGPDIEEYRLQEENGFALTKDFIDRIDAQTDLVILGNPNNPTGRNIGKDVLEGIVQKCAKTGTTLLVDECFLRLSTGSVSARNYLDRCPQLYVVDAYTKLFSIPGVRVGFAVAAKENIDRLKAFLPEWNLSAFATEAGIACAGILTDTDFIKESVALIEEERDKMVEALSAQQIKVYPSDANFLLVQAPADLCNALTPFGIRVRDCTDFAGLGDHFCRIAIKTPVENAILTSAVKTQLSQR